MFSVVFLLYKITISCVNNTQNRVFGHNILRRLSSKFTNNRVHSVHSGKKKNPVQNLSARAVNAVSVAGFLLQRLFIALFVNHHNAVKL